MSYNKYYVLGEQNVLVPGHLHFGKYLLDRLLQHNDKIAIENYDTGKNITYKQYAQYAVSLATKLTELGVEKGDVVAVGSEKRLELYPILLAVALSGAAYTSYELQNGRSSLKHKLSLAQPHYFICSKLFFERYSDTLFSCSHIKKFILLDDGIECHYSIQNLKLDIDDIEKFTPVDVEGQTDTAIILYSSGTTGMPKGVCLSHLNSILNSLSMEPTFSDESLKTVLLSGTVHHNYHHFMLYKFLSLGRKVVYPNEFTIENVIDCVEKYQVNIAMIYPVQAYTCSKIDNVDIQKYNLDSLKIFYCRSSPLHPRVISELKKRYPNLKSVMQGYGMSEHGEVTSESWSSKGLKPGSVGMASPGLILKIVQLGTNKILGPNEKGEIRIKGPALMKGYIGINPSEYLDEDGFLKTGDSGYYDEDKYIFIVDRIREILVYRGHEIPPLELETILQSHPDVLEAGVVGKPDEDNIELPTAFVVRRQGSIITEQELIDYVAEEVPPIMFLRGGLIFTTKLPRNAQGKLLRHELRKQLIC